MALYGKSSSVRATFNMYGGKIINNTINGHGDFGGGVCGWNYTDIVMNGGEISGNKSTNGAGGGVGVSNNSTFEMNGGKITDNQALATDYYNSSSSANKDGAGGGGIMVSTSSSAVMNGGEVSYNYGLEGGGVKVVIKSSFTMNGGIITRNIIMPGGWGGAVSVGYTNTSANKCTIALNDGQIVDNNQPYKDYAYQEDSEGIALAQYSTSTIGGPIIIANNTPTWRDNSNGSGDFWVHSANQVAVNGLLYQNGQTAQIGLRVGTSVSASANVVTGVTATNLCGYPSTVYFMCQTEGKFFNTVSNCLRLANDTLGTSYFKWSYKTDGDWINLDEGEAYARLQYGEKITAVKTEITSTTGTNYVYSWPSGTDGGNPFDLTFSYIDGVENVGVTDVSKVGTYTFFVNIVSQPIVGCSNYTAFNAFRFEIVPKDITVVINNDGSMYGDGVTYNNGFNATPEADGTIKGGWQLADGSSLAFGEGYADLGISLGSFIAGKPNAVSLNTGSFAITGLSSASNYNVSFVNAVYTISPRPITVILHNDSAEFTEKVELKQKPVTAEQDDDGNYIGGGWHYADDSLQIVSGDIVNGKYPLVLTSSAVVTTGYTAVGDYSILASFINTNYEVTILNSDGSEPDAGDVASATFTVTGATITVKSATAYDPDDLYDTKKYSGSAQTIAIPQGAITLKGGVTSSTVKYVVFEKDDENIPEETPKADDTTFWTGAPTSASETSAGEYVVYSLITADNHKPLVYKWTFSIGKSKAAFELSAKQGTTTLEKDDSGAYKATYDDVAVIVSISFTTSGVTTTSCPVLIYYKGTNSGNTYGTAADADFPDNSGTTDSGAARNLGNSNAPKEAGTYRATVIADPDATSDYVLDSASDSTFTFTIEAKKVDLPTAAFATGSGTYNGNTQTVNYTYDTAAVKITACSGITDTVDGVLKTYKDLTQGASNANTATKKTTTAFTAKNAGDYAVKFDLTSTRNYKWDDEDNATGAQIVTCTVKKAQLDFTLVSPVLKDGNEVWQWDAGTTADNGITAKASSLTGLISGDTVTFDVSWYKYSNGAAGTLNLLQSGIAYEDLDVDISTFDEQASYFLLIQVAAGSASNSNDNYCLKQEDTHFTPKLEGVKTREIVIGAGKVDVSRIIWKWQLENSGADPVQYVKGAQDPDDNTKLVYSTKTVSGAITALNYTISADLSDLDYLEIDTSKGTDGYENFKYSAAGTYTLKLYIKIKDGSSYEFDTGDKDTYDADTTTTASVEFEWVINKKVISFVNDDGESLVKWAYYLSDGSDIPAVTPGCEAETEGWTVFSDKNNPTYTGESVYVKISDEYLKGLGLTLSDVRVSYTANSKSTANSEQTTTATIQISGDSAKNYQLATGSVPAFKWTIGNTKITISGWDDEVGRDLDDGNGNVFTLPSVKIDAADEETAKKLAEYIEYKYTYTFTDADGNTVTRTDVDEDTMIADLFAIADQNGQPINISVKAELSEDGKKTYDIDFDSGVENSFTSSIGDSKIKIYVSLENETSVYGDIKLNINAVYYNDNDKSNPARPFDGQYLEVSITTADGTYTFKLSELSNYVLYVKDAGEYKLTFKVDESRKETYKLGNSSVTFTVLPKPIAVPEITGEIVFAGTNIDLKEKLDANYAEYSDKEIVQWTQYDTDCYHVG
ncbi:MAG: hypothetical protein K2G96_04305, partial [Clostridia bacterium]|nr:hypothetical protein [Clostridia bacterium]